MIQEPIKRDDVKIGEYLKRFRKERGLTQQQVAADIGIIPQLYQKYERDNSMPSAAIIIVLSKAYGVSADYLLGLSDEPKPAGEKPSAAPIDNSELVKVAEAFNETTAVFSALLRQVVANEKAAGGQ